MCLIAFAVAPSEGLSLVLIANRDERLDRPTEAMHAWRDGSGVIAGIDREAGGTWLGAHPGRGRFAAITNVRDVADLRPREPGERSRGALVTSHLLSNEGGDTLASSFAGERAMRGFNVLLMDPTGIHWASNRGGQPTRVTDGVHGISNALFDTPWPKVERAKSMLAATLTDRTEPSLDALFAILADDARPPDAQLPDTGVGLALERSLSPIHIAMPGYGTRCSTVFLLRTDGTATLVERANGSEARFDVPFAR